MGQPSTNLSCRKCPDSDVAIVEKDKPTLWLVQYRDDKYEGEIGITQGEHAEHYARLFAASPKMLKACQDLFRTMDVNLSAIPPEMMRQMAERDQAWRSLRVAVHEAVGSPDESDE